MNDMSFAYQSSAETPMPFSWQHDETNPDDGSLVEVY